VKEFSVDLKEGGNERIEAGNVYESKTGNVIFLSDEQGVVVAAFPAQNVNGICSKN